MSTESTSSEGVDSSLNARAWRLRIRAGKWNAPTTGCAEGHAQANLLVLPADLADAFESFCEKNPRSCPLLERLGPGEYLTREMARDADLRTDLPRYHLYKGTEMVADVDDVTDYWGSDLVAFLLGCSFSFEWALAREGIPLYHIDQGCNVPMYRTRVPLRPVGPFQGTMVVSMRAIPMSKVSQVMRITERFPRMHGAPVHYGEPRSIGIRNLSRPDFGDAIEMPPGTVPVFWPCGVTSQEVTRSAHPPHWICHAPGHMLILDRRHEEFEVGEPS